MHIGAWMTSEGSYDFCVWAPFADDVKLEVLDDVPGLIPMQSIDGGYRCVRGLPVPPGTRYRYVLNDELTRPDPASHFQPEGVHGPSACVDHVSFPWTDAAFRPVPLSDLILYELHVGTFTPEGTFDGAIARLDDLTVLGVTAVELMPVAQFPGNRNWGYDGVYPFAVQNSYGGPDGLKRFVNACHERGLSVILDVVYNHLGPEGNYLRDFGPYFTDRYKTAWGEAVNFDGPFSDHVRRFFFQNALHWIGNHHVDGLRLDATHAIFDRRPDPFLRELSRVVHRFGERNGRAVYLFPESNLNDPRLVRSVELGGMGLDCVWNDDFHHAVHTRLTGEREGYYIDYGDPDHLAKVLGHGFAYEGEYSRFRKRSHGARAKDLPGQAFLVSIQNHDQIGNRLNGERLSSLTSFEGLKVAAGLMLLSPYVPMLFMGEEYGETHPFLYFTSHGDPELTHAVRSGRKEEFQEFGWESEPPDPDALETFIRSRISWDDRLKDPHVRLLAFYKELIRLRKTCAPLKVLDKSATQVHNVPMQDVLLMTRSAAGESCLILFNLSSETRRVQLDWKVDEQVWEKILDSADDLWNGPGSILPERLSGVVPLTALSVAVYFRRVHMP
ncbi:MAG: malto-oligosyltrehalose trehalohydrolase [Desulfomonilaceae bacterium]|nr:malto-oligosyltrehalose trehalohydrolase [Desulfomonilaceae bacterium]